MATKINFKTLSERGVKAAGLAAGVATSRMAGAALTKAKPNLDPKINAAARIVVGAFLPSIAGGGKGKKSGIIDNIADGWLADGAAALGGAFGVPGLHGIDDNLSGAYDALSYAAQQDLAYGGNHVSGDQN